MYIIYIKNDVIKSYSMNYNNATNNKILHENHAQVLTKKKSINQINLICIAIYEIL